MQKPELKSGYPNYPKSGYIWTILVTEYQCPNSGYSKSLFLECFFGIFTQLFIDLLPDRKQNRSVR